MAEYSMFDPQAMAQLEADAIEAQRKQQLAQAFMQNGSQYIPNSGKAGLFAGLAQLLRGKFEESGNKERITDILRRQFDLQNQQAGAMRQQELEDEQRKLQQEIMKASTIARETAKAGKEFAKSEFTGGGVFDPSTGSFSPSAEWMQQQLGLKRAEAGIAAANRAPPADPFAKIKAAVQAGVITPEQAQQAMQRDLLGGGQQNAPSGYRFAEGGNLEPIPGGPSDKQSTVDPKVAAAEQARDILRRLQAQEAESGPIEGRIPTEGTQKYDRTVAQLVNPFQTLTRIPGQGAQSDKELATLMASFPSVTNFEGVNAESIKNLNAYLDKIQGGAPAGGETPAQPTQTAVNPQTGQRIGLVNGEWVPI